MQHPVYVEGNVIIFSLTSSCLQFDLVDLPETILMRRLCGEKTRSADEECPRANIACDEVQ